MIDQLLLVAAVTLLSYAFYKWATANNQYFVERNVKHLNPIFLIGNSAGILSNKYTAPEYFSKIYNNFPDERIYGMFDFMKPVVIIRDPEIAKQIGVKDFDHFEDHRSFVDEKTDKLLGNSLIMLKGEKWRQMRATLSPAFTGSKMRQMFDLVSECATDVVQYFLAKAENGERVNVEMKDLYTRYANDVIATCAFGIKVNSLVEPNNEFYTDGKIVTSGNGLKQFAKFIMINIFPKLSELLGLQIVDPGVCKRFKSIILDTIDFRKRDKIYRPDMINIMMQVREGSLKQATDDKPNDEQEGFATQEESKVGKMSVNRKWNDDEIVAQCLLFFLAGFDTASTVLSYASYELVLHPEAQQKLYEEIVEMNETLGGKPIGYDALQKMKYMDQVVCEALRKWPAAVQIDRVCTKEYVYNDGNYKFTVEKGIPFIIPTIGFHYDPKYFPDPERFIPERFSDENKDKIIPGTYTPFGIGPRNCIGSRFALMEIKVMLYYLLLSFSFEANEKTEIPVKLKKIQFGLATENGINLELKPRKH